MAENATRLSTKTFIFIDNGTQWLQRLGKNGSLIALILLALVLLALVLIALVL